MSLKKTLRDAGYDLIDSPIRNHRTLQLWLKKPLNEIELYYEDIRHALLSDNELPVEEDHALQVTYQASQEYKFNIGITILERILTGLGLGNLGLNMKFSGGKSVNISYDSSRTLVVPTGHLENFLHDADFLHPNNSFLRNANRDNIIVISGVLVAKNIRSVIETNSDLQTDIDVSLNNLAEGKANFQRIADRKLEMVSEGNSEFPVAVQAHRIDWDRGEFKKLTQVTDNRYFF